MVAQAHLLPRAKIKSSFSSRVVPFGSLFEQDCQRVINNLEVESMRTNRENRLLISSKGSAQSIIKSIFFRKILIGHKLKPQTKILLSLQPS